MNMAVKDIPATKSKTKLLSLLEGSNIDFWFSVLRNTIPNLRIGGDKAVITRFRDVQEALERPEIFCVDYADRMDPSVGPFMLGRDGSTINQRDKGIMRALIQQEDLTLVKQIVERLTKQALAEGSFNGRLEVVSLLSRRVPILFTGEYFGFPGPDEASMFRWSRATQHDMFHNLSRDAAIHQRNVQAGQEMRAWLEQYLPQRRADIAAGAEQSDDIVARLLKLKCPHSIGFTEDRLLSNIMGLLVGGVETTSQAIVQILDQLFDRPDQLAAAKLAAIKDDDATVARYCWEALRFNPINPIVVRKCQQDYKIAAGTLRAKTIKKGDLVFIATRSAMRDGRELPHPNTFDHTRPDYHYLHLGYGLHRCLGDQISEVQVPAIVKALLLKKNLRRASGSDGKMDFKDGPFPERFIVEFDN